MLSKSFKSGKCKTSLKLAVSRIKLLKNRREIQVKQLRRELAQLLATGQEQTARIRVEHVIREEKTMSASDLIEIYCELIVARLPIIDSQKSCPIDLKEAIASLIFASPRCADLPELTDVRKHFLAKYGKEFVTSALELRPNCGVNRMIVEKLSAKAPDTETKMKILTAIAKEHEVKWDSKAFQEELEKPKEDLLNGSSSFTRANKMPMEPLNVNFSPDVSQTESASKKFQTGTASKPTSFNSSSHTNLRTSTPLAPPAPSEFSPSDRKAAVSTDRKAAVSEVRDSFPSEETASLKEPTWRMEFKDAASAAQAAAESAERASMAARAAAELASRGNISKQNSNESNDSSIRGSRDEVPNRVVSSKLKKRSESVNMEYDQEKGFLAMKKEEVHKLPRDELSKGISHHGRTSAEEDMEFSSQMDTVNTFDGFRESFSRKELMGSEKKHDKTGDMEFSSQMDTEKTFDTFQDSFPRKELMGSLKKHDKTGFVEENVRVNYDRSASASSIGTLDDDTIWAPSIGKHQTGNHDNLDQNSHETGSRERIFRYDNEQHVSSDYPAPVFDEYGPKPIDDKENLLDSFDKKQENQPSIFTPSTSVVNSNIFSDSHDESHPVTVEKDLASKFDDVMSVTFDDSDGLTSESEDDMSRSRKNETVHNSSLVHEKSGLGRDSYPQEELQPSSSIKAKRLMGTEEKNHFQASSSSVGAKDHEMSKLSSEGEFGLKFGRLTGGLRNRGYNHPPYTSISVVDSSLSSQETEGNPIFSTKLISPREKSFTSSGITDEERNEQGSSWTAYPSNPRMPGASTNQESGKVKGSMSEEYSQESRGNKMSTDKSEEDTTGFSVKQFVPHKEKNRRYRGGDPNPIEQGPYDSTTTNASEVFNLDKTPTKAYKELSSRMPKIDFESDVVEERDSQVNMGNRSASAGIKLSRRTKDFPAKGRSNPTRFTGYSDAPNSEAERQSSRGSSVLEPPSQTVDEAAIFQGKQNLKSSKPNPSAESLHEVSVKRENKKTTEGSPGPDTNSLNKPSDSGGITKLQEAAPLKASHVHPKLPDYETLAAHFRSLRSNRRQT